MSKPQNNPDKGIYIPLKGPLNPEASASVRNHPERYNNDNYGDRKYPILQQPGRDGQNIASDECINLPPASIQNCPPGLEYLTAIDQLLIKQKVELLEAFTGYETDNKYAIKNALGQDVFYAIEESDCLTRTFCDHNRAFHMKIFDNFHREIIHLNRPLATSLCCFPCWLQKMEVSAPSGNIIGTIEQQWTYCIPVLHIKDRAGNTVLRVEPVTEGFGCCGDMNFHIFSLTNEVIGKICKQWSGAIREFFTDADFFNVSFPLDLDVNLKAILLGATFLIDFMFFEK